LKKQLNILILCSGLLFISACATYYQKYEEFNTNVEQGNVEKAKELLANDKKGPEGRNRLLYFMNAGTLEMLSGNYSKSNEYFNQADLTIEDYQKNYGTEALALITNPMQKEYVGEDFEKVLIHYYKAINYAQLGQSEEAIVECKRLNLKIQQLNDKYTKKNRYSEDAFGLNLMGIIYESTGDINNAFISYRNAVEAYEKTYEPQFKTPIPLQLKKDVIRTAYEMGFDDEGARFEEKFQLKNAPRNKNTGEVVFFWNNGLSPVKAENSINFTIVKGQAGYVSFVNEDLGLNIPFPVSQDDKKSGGLGDLQFVRVAFPKYLERKPFYSSASIEASNKDYPLELAEDVNSIAFKTLHDRLLREMGNSLMRLATKKAAEYAMRDQNQNLGSVVGIVNAITEKADTRNWQTLPNSVYYTRIELPEGSQEIKLKLRSFDNKTIREQKFNFVIQKGKTAFQTYQNFESQSYYGRTAFAR
jgi:uncharacterized protein